MKDWYFYSGPFLGPGWYVKVRAVDADEAVAEFDRISPDLPDTDRWFGPHDAVEFWDDYYSKFRRVIRLDEGVAA